jgi:sterol 3beta-glucosyltransferase
VEPFVALAKGLRGAGADVLLAAPESFRGLAVSHAIPLHGVTGDPADLARQLVEQAGLTRLKMLRVMTRHVAGIALQVFDDVRRVCEGATCIVHSFLMTSTGHLIATELGIPEVSAQLIPVFTPTAEFAGPTFPELSLGAPYRRLTHSLNSTIYWEGGRVLYTWLRRRNPSLPPYPKRLFQTGDPLRVPILYAFSPVTIPRPKDWGPGSVITGYWFLDPAPAWRPPADLEEFIEGGPPPAYIGFGSMQGSVSLQVMGESIQALTSVGIRAVLALPESSGLSMALPPTMFRVGDVPHSWLFPRMSVVVHHGGAGTTGAALRAGRPSVVVPLTADQGFWARRLHRLGASPPPLSARRLTAKALAAAIRAATGDPAIQRRATEIKGEIQGEDGVACAVGEIARAMERFTP